MTINDTMEKIDDTRHNLVYKMYQLKQLLADDMFDSETKKMISDQMNGIEKEIKVLSTKE